ncbi:hypothetical protein G8B50_09610 [Enterococcus durans]|uniref:hypothetical protein n=1 Tax=Enterococcus durans TaxID=53345 RepID=UPI00188485CA|nr:hypothetical protein [Enterococcus durans]MBE9887928.1 hypothetical protein [Enterococcus durans]
MFEKFKLSESRKKLLQVFMTVGILTTPLVNTGLISADTINTNTAYSVANYTAPKVNPYYMGATSTMKGTATPGSTVYISKTSDFKDSKKTVRTHYSTGEFSISDSYFYNWNIQPGDNIYVRCGDASGTAFSQSTIVKVNYQKPLITQAFLNGTTGAILYNEDVIGSAYPNSNVYISTSENFNDYITVPANKYGTFTISPTDLHKLSGYKEECQIYLKSADSFTSNLMSLTSSISIIPSNLWA